jgi:hypothetical protein
VGNHAAVSKKARHVIVAIKAGNVSKGIKECEQRNQGVRRMQVSNLNIFSRLHQQQPANQKITKGTKHHQGSFANPISYI